MRKLYFHQRKRTCSSQRSRTPTCRQDMTLEWENRITSPRSRTLLLESNMAMYKSILFLTAVLCLMTRKWLDLGMEELEILKTAPNVCRQEDSHHGYPRYIETRTGRLTRSDLKRHSLLSSYSNFPLFLHSYFFMFSNLYLSITKVQPFSC